MSGACGGKWTAVERTRSSTPCAASGSVFVLLTRTLTSSTFRLALLCIVVFSGTVFALLGYVYWATTNYVHGRSDRAIVADRASLVQAYEQGGRGALVNLINQRITGRDFEAGIYLLLDRSSVVVA